MEKGISVVKLLNSNVFSFSFDYDEWPTNHKNDTACMRPYFHSIFKLRDHYQTCFPEPEFAPVDDFAEKNGDEKKTENTKVSKIKFTINLLNAIGEHI